MKASVNISSIIIGALASVSLHSCDFKDIHDLEETDATVSIAYDWTLAPDAAIDGMSLYFYPLDPAHGRTWRFDIPGKEGGRIEIPAGRYSVVTLNNDVPNITLLDTGSPATFTVEGRPVSQSSTNLLLQPGKIYTSSIPYLEVTPCDVTYTCGDESKNCPRSLIRFTPSPRVADYRVIIEALDPDIDFKRLDGRLSGLAGDISIIPGDNVPDDHSVAFTLTHDRTAGATGSFTTFPAIPSCRNTLTLNCTLYTGEQLKASIDVTDQVLNSSDPMDVLIEVPALVLDGEIQDPVGGEGDIQVGMDGWNVIIIDMETDIH